MPHLKPSSQSITGVLRQKLGQLLSMPTHAKPHTDGKPYLVERDGMLTLQFDALSLQSEMSIDAPDELVFSYTRTMMSFLLIEPNPRNIAMIGLGGGSLAKYCYRYLPQTTIEVVEINPDVIALRNEFAIPADDARFRVVLGDGAQFIREHELPIDVLMVDGFDATGLPDALCSQAFYDDCFAALSDGGIMVANLWGNDKIYDVLLDRIQTSFGTLPLVVRAEDSPNKIVFATKRGESAFSAARLQRHVQQLSQSQPLDFHAKSKKMIAARAAQSLHLPRSV